MTLKRTPNLWDEYEDWHGRIARASYMFKRMLVREIRGLGIIWSVKEDGEEEVRGIETDWGMAKYKAEQVVEALTAGT